MRVRGWLLLVTVLFLAWPFGWAQAQPRSPSPAGAPSGRLDVHVSEPGATVSVDDTPVGTSPLTAPITVGVGERKLQVQKSGFAPYEDLIDVAANAQVRVDVRLEPRAETGEIAVTVAGGAAMRVLIDGTDVGAAPYRGTLAPGKHEVAGQSAASRAPATSVTVTAGELATVELVPEERAGTLEVRLEDAKGTVLVDGEKVGEGKFRGDLTPGAHELRVTRAGYESFGKTVTIVSGEVHVETVALRRAAAGQVDGEARSDWSFDGVYGGIQLAAWFEPAGSGSSFDTSCSAIGATSCEGGLPIGGALAGYLGYAFAPIGLELFLLAGGDRVMPAASFDGSTGSDVNPLVAEPAREEAFDVGRFGGGGAFRLRILEPLGESFRLTGALGAGLAYRHLFLSRDTTAADGGTSELAPTGDGYLSAVLSSELSAQLVLSGSTALSAGLDLWLEHAGDGVQSEANDAIVLEGGAMPVSQATPAYDMASGTQFYLGPRVGLHFGP